MDYTPEQIAELERASFKLAWLENAGVNNWEGYSYAMAEFYGDEDD